LSYFPWEAFMGDIGDDWRAFNKYFIPRIRATRSKRMKRFHENLDALRELLEWWNISIAVNNRGHHIQFRCEEYIANYYPSTRNFFFQRPALLPTIKVRPEDVILIFLQQARKIESEPSELFKAWWNFKEDTSIPSEVVKVGTYLMPQVRSEILRLASYRYSILEKVDPYEFEHLVAELLKDQGYRATVTLARGDGGKDVIAIRDEDKREYVTLVECKKWLKHNVGIEIVQRAIGVKYIDRADHSMIVTTARFTEQATKEAQKVSGEITLVDTNTLRYWLTRFEQKRRENLTPDKA
jgi:HJR/Mrr/RecB family endonuclease